MYSTRNSRAIFSPLKPGKPDTRILIEEAAAVTDGTVDVIRCAGKSHCCGDGCPTGPHLMIVTCSLGSARSVTAI